MLTAFLSLPVWKIDRETSYFSHKIICGPTRYWRYSVCSPLFAWGLRPPLLRRPSAVSLYRGGVEKFCSKFSEREPKTLFHFLCFLKRIVSFCVGLCVGKHSRYRGRDDGSGDGSVFWYYRYLLRSEQDDIASVFFLFLFLLLQTWLITLETAPMGSAVLKSFFLFLLVSTATACNLSLSVCLVTAWFIRLPDSD